MNNSGQWYIVHDDENEGDTPVSLQLQTVDVTTTSVENVPSAMTSGEGLLPSKPVPSRLSDAVPMPSPAPAPAPAPELPETQPPDNIGATTQPAAPTAEVLAQRLRSISGSTGKPTTALERLRMRAAAAAEAEIAKKRCVDVVCALSNTKAWHAGLFRPKFSCALLYRASGEAYVAAWSNVNKLARDNFSPTIRT